VTVFVQTLFNALALGSIYAVLALGFVLVFKATQVLNFAHGALAMAGGLFLAFLVAGGMPVPFLSDWNPLAGVADTLWGWILNLALALVFAGILGLILERVAIRPMVGQPLFAMAVITLGLEIAVRAFAVDSASLENRSIGAPWGTDAFLIGEARVPWSYVACIIFAVVSFVAVYFFYQSRLGVAMRAVAFDQEAAMAQGIDVGRVFAIAWALGAALGALGAIMFSFSPRLPGAIDVEQHPILAFRALPVIVLGGLDSVQGALVGGILIGTVEVFAGEYLSGYTSILGVGFQQIVPYVLMLGVLLIRPYGLFGTEEIRRV
jgi:branched-chain amino acid transport system permease protein